LIKTIKFDNHQPFRRGKEGKTMTQPQKHPYYKGEKHNEEWQLFEGEQGCEVVEELCVSMDKAPPVLPAPKTKEPPPPVTKTAAVKAPSPPAEPKKHKLIQLLDYLTSVRLNIE
jgi:hypothetical protein